MGKNEKIVSTDDGAFVNWMKKIEKEAIAKAEKELAEEAKKSRNDKSMPKKI